MAEFGSKLVGGAADTAAQTALYNAAQKIDENHLAGGNLQQGVENALATTGDALKFGAGLHVATALTGHAVLFGAQKAVDGLQGFISDQIIPKAGQAAADFVTDRAVASGAMTQEAADKYSADVGIPDSEGAAARAELLKTPPKPLTNAERAEAFEKIGRELKEHLGPVIKVGDQMAAQLKSEARPSMERLLDEAPKDLGVTPEDHLKRMVDSARAVVQSEKEAAQKLLSDPSQYPVGIAHRVQMIAASAEDRLNNLLDQTTPSLYEDSAIHHAIESQGLTGNLLDAAHKQGAREFSAIADNATGWSLKPIDIHDFINKERDTVYDWAYKKKYTGPDAEAGNILKSVGQDITKTMHDANVRGPQAALQQRIDDAISERKQILGPKGALRNSLLEERAKKGGTEWTLRSKKLNTYAGKLGAFRGSDEEEGVKRLLENTQEIMDIYKKSTADLANYNYDKKIVQDLRDTQQAAEAQRAQKLRSLQQHIDATGTTTVKGTAQNVEMNRMKALANGPFYTGIDPASGLAESTGINRRPPPGQTPLTSIPVLRAVQSAARNPLQTLQTISRLETFNQQGVRKIQAGINAAFKKAGDAGSLMFEQAKPIIAYEAAKQSYQKQLAKRVELDGDPQQVAMRYHAALQENQSEPGIQSPIAEHAPQFTKAVGDQQTKVNQYLFSIFPKDQSQILGIAGGKFSKYQPSKTEMLEYQGKEAVAKDPLIIFDKMAKGTLSADDMAVVDKLWPEIANQARVAASAKAAQTKQDLTTKQKGQLSILLGHPVDDTQAPTLGVVLQKNFADQTTAKKAAQAKANEGITTFAKDSKTPSQALIK